MSNTRSVVVFYDSPCIDGAAAAWAVNEGLKNQPNIELNYVPIGYGDLEERTQKILSNISDGVEVIFLDTSPKDDTLALLFNPTDDIPRIKKLTVVDHHSGEVARLTKFEAAQKAKSSGSTTLITPEFQLVLDPKKPSAALLAWEYFNQDKPAPKLLEWVGKMEPPSTLRNDHDRAMAAFIDSQDITTPEEMFPTIDRLVVMPLDEMAAGGNSILADQLNNIRKGIEHLFLYAKLELLPGRVEWVPIVNANVQNFGRPVDDTLIKEACAGATCGVSGAWFVQEDGTVKLSLRSKGIPDVGEIAKYLGGTIGVDGSGHATAAAVEFRNLLEFAQSVLLYPKEQMLEERWAAKHLGTHTASVVSMRPARR